MKLRDSRIIKSLILKLARFNAEPPSAILKWHGDGASPVHSGIMLGLVITFCLIVSSPLLWDRHCSHPFIYEETEIEKIEGIYEETDTEKIEGGHIISKDRWKFPICFHDWKWKIITLGKSKQLSVNSLDVSVSIIHKNDVVYFEFLIKMGYFIVLDSYYVLDS